MSDEPDEIDQLLATKVVSTREGTEIPPVAKFLQIIGHVVFWLGTIGFLIAFFSDKYFWGEGDIQTANFFIANGLDGAVGGLLLIAIASHLRQQTMTNRLLAQVLKKE
jgi:hypothetical protein